MTEVDKPKVDERVSVRIFVTDCEGPISKNDNAFEVASRFIPEGGEFFGRVSRYDDVLADVVKRPGYKAGDTLKLILPFLKAYGATDEAVAEYSRRDVRLIPGARETLAYVKGMMPSYIVSTSYKHYIEAVCEVTGFPSGDAYSTLIQFDRYEITLEEQDRLKRLCQEILDMPILNPSPVTTEDMSEEDKPILKRLDEIFWSEVSSMRCGRMLSDVNPIGGEGKAKAVEEVASKNRCTLADVLYVGDSITDVAPLRLVRKAGGASVSFNGNEYALREAEVAVVSGTTVPTTALAYLFKIGGRQLILEAASDWPNRLQRLSLPSSMINALKSYGSEIPIEVSPIKEENRMKLTEKSKYARRAVRGEAVGSLG